ncbi:MAG: hypothetical protein CVT72_16425 [Alphaproteobacteria bacterium HGW-Alphaproteobacteria-11]|nr:MAG: hypothetical protein CVT72_16425 [Alphaproteobacteria bacterium HGW-Alphaproteobacteria-11]
MDMTEPRIFEAAEEAPRPAFPAIRRGFAMRCPACGHGNVFRRFLKIADTCGHCGEELHHHRADDAPPYFTIMVVGHIVVPMMLWTELAWLPPIWVHAALWPAMTLALSLWFLPRLKGAIVGWQWALRMHGFGGETED